MAELCRPDQDSARGGKRMPVILILENVRSMHNVGSVFRSCDAFSVQELILCGYTPTPPHREIHKTALGAENSVPWRYVPDIHFCIASLKHEGWYLAGLEQADGSVSDPEILCSSGSKIALIAGNEVEGVSQEVLSRCDAVWEIPQYGSKHSLNISVAAGIALYGITMCMLKKA